MSPGSVAAPKVFGGGAKRRAASITLPGRYSRARPAVSRQWTVASGAYIDMLPVAGRYTSPALTCAVLDR